MLVRLWLHLFQILLRLSFSKAFEIKNKSNMNWKVAAINEQTDNI